MYSSAYLGCRVCLETLAVEPLCLDLNSLLCTSAGRSDCSAAFQGLTAWGGSWLGTSKDCTADTAC